MTYCGIQVFQSPLVAVFASIFVSAFVHEYLLALALRFASPVLLLEFAGLGGKYMHRYTVPSNLHFCVYLCSSLLPDATIWQEEAFKSFCIAWFKFWWSKLDLLLPSRTGSSPVLSKRGKINYNIKKS